MVTNLQPKTHNQSEEIGRKTIRKRTIQKKWISKRCTSDVYIVLILESVQTA